MIKFGVDASEFALLENTLDRLSEKAIPNAVRNTLNTLAINTADKARDALPKLFTLRNRFTSTSVRSYLCKERRNINRMFTEAGSVNGYMEAMESGHTVSGGPNLSDPKSGVAIPTGSAAGQPSGKRTLPKRPGKRLAALRAPFKPPVGRGAKNPKQKLLVALNMAVRANADTVLLGKEHGMSRLGVYALGKANYEGRGWPTGLTIAMIYQLDKASTTVKPHPWLQPASDATASTRAEVYTAMLTRQLAMEKAYRSL
jgi:hypothetical protein